MAVLENSQGSKRLTFLKESLFLGCCCTYVRVDYKHKLNFKLRTSAILKPKMVKSKIYVVVYKTKNSSLQAEDTMNPMVQLRPQFVVTLARQA